MRLNKNIMKCCGIMNTLLNKVIIVESGNYTHHENNKCGYIFECDGFVCLRVVRVELIK